MWTLVAIAARKRKKTPKTACHLSRSRESEKSLTTMAKSPSRSTGRTSTPLIPASMSSRKKGR